MAGLPLFTFVLLAVALANARVAKNTPGNSVRLQILRPDQLAEEHSGQFEGDMVLTKAQKRALLGYTRNGMISSIYRWPNKTVPVLISEEDFTPKLVKQIERAMRKIESVSCVKFVPHLEEHDDYVSITGKKDAGCSSHVGFIGGMQEFSLEPPGCIRFGTMLHEFLHTLGFYHQHSASDRDEFIDIKWENIQEREKNNFKKYSNATVTDFGVGYDYGSVMHYSSDAFSKNENDTIVPKDKNAKIGQRVGLSNKDIAKLNKMYRC